MTVLLWEVRVGSPVHNKMTKNRRELLDTLTKRQLIMLGEQHGVDLSMSDTKIGMGSRLMSQLTAKQIEYGVKSYKK